LAEAAQATRARAVERVTEAAEEIASAVDELGRSLSIANWAAQPGKRWKVALGAATVGKRHGGTPIAEVVERLRELPSVLEQQRTPPEAEPAAEIHFGWSKLGAPPQPPGSMRSS
jgi:signal recognition particle subunit SEC65